jgi:serine/threonine-protein kinase
MNEVTQADSTAAAAAQDFSGRTFGDYSVIRRLGQGGMGAVYLADQISLKRKVALKFLRPELAANPAALKRFRTEAEAIARLNHANIVQVYAIGEADGQNYMALEYVDGRTLRDLVVRKGPPDLPICLAIMRQVAAALQRACEAGIVHRDIKPENILITRKVEVKVADFGLSRLLNPTEDVSLTQSGMTLGTPMYMSPEQVRGQTLDSRSDIYSFGVTCYYMFAGQPPFHGQTAIEVALKHCEETPPPLQSLRPDLPPELCAFVHRMMHKDPGKRPASGRDILLELNQGFRNVPSTDVSLPELTGASPIAAGDRSSGAGSTVALPASSPKWRMPAIVAASLLAAGLLGAGIKLARNAIAKPAVEINEQPNLEIVSNTERLLLLGVEENATPKPDKLREGMMYHVRLGLLYFEQGRFEEAERFFGDLHRRSNAPQQYTILGYLGNAVALSFRDDAESVDKALKMFQDLRSRFPRYNTALNPAVMSPEDSINFRYWFVRALDRLATPTGVLPPSLERIREDAKGRRPGGGPGPQGKGGDSK